MTYDKFTKTSIRIPYDEYINLYNDIYIHPLCKDVIMYRGNFNIQVLDDKTIVVRVNGEDFIAPALHNAESFLWMMEAEKKLSEIM